jgi:hypothetical protein
MQSLMLPGVMYTEYDLRKLHIPQYSTQPFETSTKRIEYLHLGMLHYFDRDSDSYL